MILKNTTQTAKKENNEEEMRKSGQYMRPHENQTIGEIHVYKQRQY